MSNMLRRHCIALFLCCWALQALGQWDWGGGGSKAPPPPPPLGGTGVFRWGQLNNVTEAVALAKEGLRKQGIDPDDKYGMGLRLPVLILHTHPIAESVIGIHDDLLRYHHGLHCAITTIQKHLGPWTPVDIYVFARPKHMGLSTVPSWLTNNPGVYLVPVNEQAWRFPEYLRPEDMGWSGGFGVTGVVGHTHQSYRLMGEWRLTAAPAFAKALGYKYFLQSDSDIYVTQPYPYNLVDIMFDHGFWLANREQFFNEISEYTRGLPEFTAFWLVTRQRNVTGSLFKHTRPPDITGLRSLNVFTANPEDPNWVGWDGHMLSGNWQIIDLAWWFDKWVQDYVYLVIRTGAHIEHRWNELAVQSMLWQVTVPDDKFHVFTKDKLSLDHSRRFPDVFLKCYGLLNKTLPLVHWHPDGGMLPVDE